MWLYIALDGTPNIDCYWVGAVPKLRGYWLYGPQLLVPLVAADGAPSLRQQQRLEGLGFRVWGLGFRVWGLGFRVEGSGFGD